MLRQVFRQATRLVLSYNQNTARLARGKIRAVIVIPLWSRALRRYTSLILKTEKSQWLKRGSRGSSRSGDTTNTFMFIYVNVWQRYLIAMFLFGPSVQRQRAREGIKNVKIWRVVVKCAYINSHIASSCLSERNTRNSQGISQHTSSNTPKNLKLVTVPTVNIILPI